MRREGVGGAAIVLTPIRAARDKMMHEDESWQELFRLLLAETSVENIL